MASVMLEALTMLVPVKAAALKVPEEVIAGPAEVSIAFTSV